MSKDITLQDVFEAVSGISSKVDSLSVAFDSLSGRVDSLSVAFDSLSGRVDSLSVRLDALESSTKKDHQDTLEAVHALSSAMDARFDAMDRRMDNLETEFHDFRIELGLQVKRTNTKITVFTEELVAEKSLSPDGARRILALEPFPQG